MDIELRCSSGADAGAIAEIYRPIVERTATSFELTPPSDAEFAKRIESTLADYPWIVATHAERVVGYAYGSRFRGRAAYDWSVESSAYVHPEAYLKGVGRRLYRALLEILTAQQFVTAIAGITLPNPASVRLHESLGFESVGAFQAVGYKFDTWHDVGFWQKRLREPTSSAVRPRPFSEVQNAGELTRIFDRAAAAKPTG